MLGKDRSELKDKIEEAQLDILFDDSHCFELGGRQFELYATPGGESLDSLVVWLPGDKIAVVGNLFGPIFGHMPNLYTLRGDKIRSAMRYIESIERVKALRPAMIITGHQVIEGVEEIQQTITQLSEAVHASEPSLAAWRTPGLGALGKELACGRVPRVGRFPAGRNRGWRWARRLARRGS